MSLRPLFLAGLASLVAVPAMAQEATVDSCGGTYTVDAVPERAITLNQQATEVMLALGLQEHMVGTAYLDDFIPEPWTEAYEAIPVLAERYPAMEVVLVEEPDFLFAGFASAFSEDNLGAETEWHERGIATYLVDASCNDKNPPDVPLTTASITRDIEVVGDIFGVEDRAAELIEATEARLAVVAERNVGAGRSAFIFDSGDETPFSIGCCGSPALLASTVGLESITDDLEGRWVDVSWERVVQENPDVIVLIEADWSSAAEKREYMENDPVLATLDAVSEERFLIIPFAQTLLGMQFATGVETLAAQLEAME